MFLIQEASNAHAHTDTDDPHQRQQHQVSPGVERKPRRAIDGSGSTARRKRRTSVSTQHLVHNNEDEQVDIDEPTSHDYTHFDVDIIAVQVNGRAIYEICKGLAW